MHLLMVDKVRGLGSRGIWNFAKIVKLEDLNKNFHYCFCKVVLCVASWINYVYHILV